MKAPTAHLKPTNIKFCHINNRSRHPKSNKYYLINLIYYTGNFFSKMTKFQPKWSLSFTIGILWHLMTSTNLITLVINYILDLIHLERRISVVAIRLNIKLHVAGLPIGGRYPWQNKLIRQNIFCEISSGKCVDCVVCPIGLQRTVRSVT